jgi:hypothetical protein
LSAGATLPTTTSPYHDHFRHPRKTGTFYFAQNRNFLLCLDSKIGPEICVQISPKGQVVVQLEL